MAEAAMKEWDEPPPVATEAGGDDIGIADITAEAPAEAEPPSSPSEPDALDKLLSDYDQGTGNGAGNGAATEFGADYTADELARLLGEDHPDAAARQQSEQEFAAAQQRYAGESAQSAVDLAQRDRALAEAQQTIGSLQNVIAQEQFRQHQARSLEDFKRLTVQEQSKLDGLDVPENHVETFLLAEAARDPELQRAWEGKYYQPPGPLERARVAADIQAWAEGQARAVLQLSNPLARRMAQQNIEQSMRQMWSQAFPDPATYRANAAKYVQQALNKMHKDARKPRIDPDATADHFAVAQAVRGASAKSAPPEPPPNLGRMTQGEFQRHTMEKYGF